MTRARLISSDIRITPVILAGGSGTRLWPLSRKSYPKQFVPLVGDTTLFQSVARRLSGGTEYVTFARPMVLTNALFRVIIAEQLAQEGIDPVSYTHLDVYKRQADGTDQCLSLIHI
ncbi:sugar phosphate nucleotidyltransferase [Sphingobium sp. B2]|uniref:sugar phosphate nucleotidyltransferase n=1 Tax=Sphingobium sp. B2 TaxID=2583228 RepID=UPI0011A8FFF7|nr:sugar phosphate nucleotidyltransferase [Sphingobium sp. B2]